MDSADDDQDQLDANPKDRLHRRSPMHDEEAFDITQIRRARREKSVR